MYSLCALLGPSEDLQNRLATHPRAPLVDLARDLAMVPLSESWLQQVKQPSAEEQAQGSRAPVANSLFEFLTPSMEHWIRGLSKGTAIAYVETEYFSGEGFERAVVWRDGAPVLGPLDGAGAINRVLKFLGVVAEPGREEFDVVGLGRHRTLEEWLSEARRDPRDEGIGGKRQIDQNL